MTDGASLPVRSNDDEIGNPLQTLLQAAKSFRLDSIVVCEQN